jgi:hypothetical protein
MELQHTGFASPGHGRFVTFAAQTGADGVGRLGVVFDDKNLRHAGRIICDFTLRGERPIIVVLELVELLGERFDWLHPVVDPLNGLHDFLCR